MTLGSVRDSVPRDILELYRDGLRSQDMMELNSLGITPEQALQDGYTLSAVCKTIVVDGTAAGMFGVARSPLSNSGYIWLLGTQLMMTIPKNQFLRESRKWLDELAKDYDVVGNLVHQDNSVHIKWLRWLGFTFLGRHHPFIHFARITPCATLHSSP